MPPRYSYWTILAGGLPTAFRAAEREELEPTFKRLREKHPDAEMKWFARGRLWASPEDARAERDRERPPMGGARGQRHGVPTAARGRDWRPGGEHRDPRQKYQDAKKARNVERRQEKFARKHGEDPWRGAPREKPHGDTLAPRAQTNRRFDKPPGGAPRGDGRDRVPREKPHGDALRPDARRFSAGAKKFAPPKGRGGTPRNTRDGREGAATPDAAWRSRPPREKPHGDKLAPRGPRDRQFDRPPSGAPRSDWRDRPPREKPHGDKLAPRGPRNRQFDRPPSGAPRNDWRDRPPREKPHGDKLAPRGPRDRQADRPPSGAPRNDWRDREKPHGDKLARAQRPFDRRSFPRSQNVEEPPPQRPRGPNREPKPSESPQPTPPPRPSEPVVPPPGPPERGGPVKAKRDRR